MKKFVISFCIGVFAAFQVSGQVMGYPFPGDTQYPDNEGRRIDRIILENDRSFKTIVVDETNQVALCASDNLNIPYIVRFDLSTFSKTGRLILDNGMTSITSSAIDPISGNIWFGSKGYCLLIDPIQFEILRIVPIGNFQVVKILFHPIDHKVLLLIKGDQDGVIEMDPMDMSYGFYPFPGFKNVFIDAAISSKEMSLVILASSTQSHVILADLNGYQAVSTTEIPGNHPAAAIALNAVRNELYVAATGLPAYVHRYDFPEMTGKGSLELPFGERPRNFMFCDDLGTHVLLNDGDSSGGLIKIDAASFQRVDRLDFGDLKYPACYDGFQNTILIATENTPGAILQVDPDTFTITRQHEFLDCEISAGEIFGAPALNSIYLVVKNLGAARLVGFNPGTGQRNCHIDLPAVTGAVILSACDEHNSIAYLVESGDPEWIISVDLQKGEMLERKQLPVNGEYKDIEYVEASNSLFLLTNDSIIEIDAVSFSSIDSKALESDVIPAVTFALDRQHSFLLVGGGGNFGKMVQYSFSPLAFNGIIELNPGERKVVLLEADKSSMEIFTVVDATPYKIKRFDTTTLEFTMTLNLPFNGIDLIGFHIMSNLDQALVIEKGGTTRIHRLDIHDNTWISPVTLQPGECYIDGHIVESEPYAFIGLAGICPSIVRYGATQAQAIHGSWASLDQTSYLESLNFYSHEAGNQVRLAVYDCAGMLLWESGLLENTAENDWLEALVSEGDPSELMLAPDDYLLAFQVTGNGRSPSATAAAPGRSIRSAWPYGQFPNALVTWDDTDVLWSIYADCSPVQPTPTPSSTSTPETPNSPSPTRSPEPSSTPTTSFSPTCTPTQEPQNTATPTISPSNSPTPTEHPADTPTATPTPETTHTPSPTQNPDPSATPTTGFTPTHTPTQKPQHSPTPTMSPSNSPTPTSCSTMTPRPGSGVDLMLTKSKFHPGDRFYLQARMANTEPSPLNVELYVILDVYGDYWFGPGWSQHVDAYKLNGFLGVRTLTIFDFIWPEVDSEAQGIAFWAGMVAEGESTIFGFYDRIEFAYGAKTETPTPTPTNTPTQGETPTPAPTGTSTQPHTPTPEPTETATPEPDGIRYVFVTKDPVAYPGENCQEQDIYCFAPERMYFCSEWQPIVFLENVGALPVNVSIKLDGRNPDDFQVEYHNLYINPAETKAVNTRFCPLSPPDQLKSAEMIVEWNGGSVMIEVKGWCVAGKGENRR